MLETGVTRKGMLMHSTLPRSVIALRTEKGCGLGSRNTVGGFGRKSCRLMEANARSVG
ncbi:hypothetical protein LCGC14_2083430, partial [marine sediment metagenome]